VANVNRAIGARSREQQAAAEPVDAGHAATRLLIEVAIGGKIGPVAGRTFDVPGARPPLVETNVATNTMDG